MDVANTGQPKRSATPESALSQGPLQFWIRVGLFVAMEAGLLWHLCKGLKDQAFRFFDTPAPLARSDRPVSYWCYSATVMLGICAVVWLAWDGLGTELQIVLACSRDTSFCP